WADRLDWFFAVDMAIYHTTGANPRIPVVPDGFLSLGVERKKSGKSRRSYATWEENDTVPILVLEMVSHKPGGEYDKKLEIYRKLGVLYYVIYNPEFWQRDRQQPFQVYKLINEAYQLQLGEPYWMPEVRLGLGRAQQVIGGIEQEVLLWHSAQGIAHPLPETAMRQLKQQLQMERQQVTLERQRAAQERQRAERLAAHLRSLGIDPDQLPE
ncbi:MAG: Uma2 family endonuclease, partial [Cyanobacteria bacterium P01_H01_bin.121]